MPLLLWRTCSHVTCTPPIDTIKRSSIRYQCYRREVETSPSPSQTAYLTMAASRLLPTRHPVQISFKCVVTCRLNRSFVCLVDNARELQASLSADEAARWCCVWDKDSCMDWDTYTTTAQTGQLRLCQVRQCATPGLHTVSLEAAYQKLASYQCTDFPETFSDALINGVLALLASKRGLWSLSERNTCWVIHQLVGGVHDITTPEALTHA